jgi:hypothetical protein
LKEFIREAPLKRAFRLPGQSGRENLQTAPVVKVVRLPKEIRIAELKCKCSS